MTEITINPIYIILGAYAVFKVAASVWICKHEFQYPIWNKEGIQIPRGLHHKAQSFLRNWAINPEWGLLKAIAFIPTFFATGTRFIHSFFPWRVQKTPPFCRNCKDKGEYYDRSMFANECGWKRCKCQDEEQPSNELPDCSCHVCLDKKTIGKNRTCPHCDKARLVRNMLNDADVSASQTHFDVWGIDDLPYRYLGKPSSLCGNPDVKDLSNLRCNQHWIQRKEPTDLHVGDTVAIQSVNRGHRDANLLGKPLRILGICLPFAAVESSGRVCSPGRHIETIDLRGMVLYGEKRVVEVKSKQDYQPLLNPRKLREGDKFVVLQVNECSTDGSWRGEAFRVTKPVHIADGSKACTRRGDAAIEAQHLSFIHFDAPTSIACGNLMIIPANDQYIRATRCHCPDIGYGS